MTQQSVFLLLLIPVQPNSNDSFLVQGFSQTSFTYLEVVNILVAAEKRIRMERKEPEFSFGPEDVESGNIGKQLIPEDYLAANPVIIDFVTKRIPTVLFGSYMFQINLI